MDLDGVGSGRGGTVSFNWASTSGGGAYDRGTMTFDGTTIEGNRAGGGGIFNGTPVAVAPDARQNGGCGAEGQGGGGIYLCDGSATATDSTVFNET